jgi:hypothetical protein
MVAKGILCSYGFKTYKDQMTVGIEAEMRALVSRANCLTKKNLKTCDMEAKKNHLG